MRSACAILTNHSMDTHVTENLEVETKSKEVLTRFLTEAIVLAAVTVMVYAMTYCFERGYCYAFGIPFDCIEVTVTQMIPNGIVIVVTIAIFFWFTFPVIGNVKISKTALGAAASSYCVVTAIAMSFDIETFYLTFMLVISAIVMLPQVRLSGSARRSAFAVVTVALLLQTAIVMGNINASVKKEFMVSTAEPDWIVLRRYGDVLVMAKLEGKKLTREFRFEQYSEAKSSFKIIKTGRLVHLKF